METNETTNTSVLHTNQTRFRIIVNLNDTRICAAQLYCSLNVGISVSCMLVSERITSFFIVFAYTFFFYFGVSFCFKVILLLFTSGFCSAKQIYYKFRQKSTNTTATNMVESDTLYNIVIPSMIMLGLIVMNAVVYLIIMRYRNRT